jgi:hypothetical protein
VPLHVTYDNTAVRDGIGAQVHRILSVQALARQFGLSYLHSPVARVRYQGFANQLRKEHDHDCADKWNRFLNLGYGHETPETCGIDFAREHRGVRLRLWSAAWLWLQGRRGLKSRQAQGGRHELARIKSAFPIVNRRPETFELLRDQLRTQYAMTPKPTVNYDRDRLQVAIHIRRGDVTLQSKYRRRFIPCSVYEQIIQQLSDVSERAPVFHVFSEADPSAARHGLEELESLPGVTLHLNGDAFSAFHHLVSSDALVLGVSSFSFVAGLYHRGVVLNFPGHNPHLPTWVKIGRGGQFDAGEVRRRLASQLVRQAA